MTIDLKGWIRNVKDICLKPEKTDGDINTVIGFLEDMNNLFYDLKELKTDNEKIKWVNNVKDFFNVSELEHMKTERTIIKKTEE